MKNTKNIIKTAKNQSELARIVGVDRHSIARWRKEPGAPSPNGNGHYDVTAWLQWIDARCKKSQETAELKGQLIQRKITKLEIENGIAMGRYVAVDDVRQWVEQVKAQAERVLLAGPKSLAPQVVGLSIPEAEKLLKEWVNDRLQVLSDDPRGTNSTDGDSGTVPEV